MMYMCASASDYDDWEMVYENPGWGSDDLIPLLRKVWVCDLTLALLNSHCSYNCNLYPYTD